MIHKQKKMTKAQFKRLAEYLKLLRLEFRPVEEYMLCDLTKRRAAFIERNYRNYIHSLNIVEHFVLSNIFDSGVKYNERPNFRKSKDAVLLNEQILNERTKKSVIAPKKNKTCVRPITLLQKSAMKNLSNTEKLITSDTSRIS